MSISLYEVLGAGRGQFGILEGVSFAYLTLCSPRSGPRAIWNFGGSFYIMFISLYVVLRAGRGQFGNLEGFLLPISLYVVLRAGCAQFGNLA